MGFFTALAIGATIASTAVKYKASRDARKARKSLAREQGELIAEQKKEATTKRKSLIKSQRAQVGGGGGSGGGYTTKKTGSAGIIDKEQLG